MPAATTLSDQDFRLRTMLSDPPCVRVQLEVAIEPALWASLPKTLAVLRTASSIDLFRALNAQAARYMIADIAAATPKPTAPMRPDAGGMILHARSLHIAGRRALTPYFYEVQSCPEWAGPGNQVYDLTLEYGHGDDPRNLSVCYMVVHPSGYLTPCDDCTPPDFIDHVLAARKDPNTPIALRPLLDRLLVAAPDRTTLPQRLAPIVREVLDQRRPS